MDDAELTRFITGTFEGVDVTTIPGGTFFMYDPGRTLPPDRKFPFVTLVTSDAFDRASDLERPGVFRLNIGVSKETYRSLFGPPPAPPVGDGVVDTGHDFTALDQLLPHPVYAPQSWLSVLNPGPATLETVKSLLAEAYAQAAKRHARTQPATDA